MNALEEYKLKILNLKARPNGVTSGDYTNEVFELIIESSDKLD